MFSRNHNLHFSNTITNSNPNKTQRRPQNTSKTPQKTTASEQKTRETKKFPRKPPEIHLLFSKTHNPHPFTFTTKENPTKPNGDPKTRQKHPKHELHKKKKQIKLRNSHEKQSKLT